MVFLCSNLCIKCFFGKSTIHWFPLKSLSHTQKPWNDLGITPRSCMWECEWLNHLNRTFKRTYPSAKNMFNWTYVWIEQVIVRRTVSGRDDVSIVWVAETGKIQTSRGEEESCWVLHVGQGKSKCPDLILQTLGLMREITQQLISLFVFVSTICLKSFFSPLISSGWHQCFVLLAFLFDKKNIIIRRKKDKLLV